MLHSFLAEECMIQYLIVIDVGTKCIYIPVGVRNRVRNSFSVSSLATPRLVYTISFL